MSEKRKKEHVEVHLKEKVQADYNYWNDIRLIHQSLPEINLNEIDATIEIFGKELAAPMIISAITGGYKKAEQINRNLAKAASEVGVGLGIGSQRAGIENKNLEKTYSVIKEFDVPLVIANLGVPQFIAQKGGKVFTIEDAEHAMEMIDADLLAIHLNYLQEVVQPEGNTNAHGCLAAIRRIALRLPVIAKETGAGISKEMALKLKKIGVKGIDVGGLGGTSFAAVEYYRAKMNDDERRERLGKTFWSWGIPTPVSVIQADVGLPIIATGGIRSGLDVARAVSIGASAAGIAGQLVKAANESANAVSKELTIFIDELKAAMFLTSSPSISKLKRQKVIVTGKTRDWIEQV